MEVNEQKLIAWMEKMEWTPEQIESALGRIRSNKKMQTIIMPEHYAHEAAIFADMVCRIEHGLREGSKQYDECFDDAFQHFCFEAWANSTGIDFDSDGTKSGNPTWSKAKDAVSQFMAHGWFGPVFLRQFVQTAGEIKKAQARMKSAAMDLTHLALTYRGKMPVHRKGGTYVQYEMPSSKDKSKEERQRIYAQVTANNLLRSIMLVLFMRAAEQIFRVDVDALHKTLEGFVNSGGGGQSLKSTILNQNWRANFTKKFDDQFRLFLDANGIEKFDFEGTLNQALGGSPEAIRSATEVTTQERIAEIEKRQAEKAQSVEAKGNQARVTKLRGELEKGAQQNKPTPSAKPNKGKKR